MIHGKRKNGNQIRSGEAMFGLVNSECLPDRMSGERLNTFANSAFNPLEYNMTKNILLIAF